MLLIILIMNSCKEELTPLMFFFCKNLDEIRDEIQERLQENKDIEMTDEDKKDFETATHCFICGDKLKNSYKNEKEAQK